MKFISTGGKSNPVSFFEAMKSGLAPDGGLYMPEKVPVIDLEFWNTFTKLSFEEIAFAMSKPYLKQDLSDEALKSVVTDSFNFPIELRQIEDNRFVLELFHGPTLAFKDFGARFMARLFSEQAKKKQEEITILVATSGDTGSAVANGFHNVEGVNVCVLYPKGKVSDLQEKQMTTLGGNITALEVDGVFDDCQRLVKQAFQDKDIAGKMQLSSANSINIARLLPQSFYYIFAAAELKKKGAGPIVFSVPSGNFGNLTGGLLAKKMGMKVQKFIAATNRNHVVPSYLEGKPFYPKPSVQTISNAMDVGDPSNFVRMQYLYNNNDEELRNDILGYYYTDDQTRETIKSVYEQFGYLMCPHTAIGYRAAMECENIIGENIPIVTLATAHPVKFRDVIEPVINQPIPIPASLEPVLSKEKVADKMDTEFESFKAYLLSTK